MHRGLPEGNTKLVLKAIKALGPSDLGPGLRLLLRDIPSSGYIRQTPSYGSTPHRVLHVNTSYI